MTTEDAAHGRAIQDQFSRQAAGFAGAKELHADDVGALVAARPQPGDRAIDFACGPGTVACALASASATSLASTRQQPCSPMGL